MTLWDNVRLAVRTLRSRPSLVVGTVMSLGIGIGATTAVFSVVDAVQLSASPYVDADCLYIPKVTDGTFPLEPLVASARRVNDLIGTSAVDDAIMWDTFPVTAMHGDQPASLDTAKVTPNAFQFFGVPPLLGRTFTGRFSDVFNQPPERVVVLGYRYWQRIFGGARDVVGRTLELDSQPHTIIGVMPERFRFLDKDVYLPLPQPDSPSLSMVRLAPGVTPSAAAAQMDAVDAGHRRRLGLPNLEAWQLSVVSAREEATGHLNRVLAILAGAVTLLLVIGCVNASIMLVTHGVARGQALTVRAALGASAVHLFRQVLTESVVLSLLGGLAGVITSYALVAATMTLVPSGVIPSDMVVGLNGRVLAFSALIALLTGIMSGMLPAVRLARAAGSTARLTGRATVQPPGSARKHRALIAAQAALTIVLLAGSAAALRTFWSLATAPLGYEPRGVQTVQVMLSENELLEWPARVAYFDRLRSVIAALPGVEAVGVTWQDTLPIVRDRSLITRAGRNEPEPTRVAMQVVDEAYFGVLRMPVLRGRVWTASENTRGLRLAVINNEMAQRYWPGADPIGQRLRVDGMRRFSPYQVDSPGNDSWFEVVGVVGSMANAGLRQSPLPQIYVPYTVVPWDMVTMLVRTGGSPLPESLLATTVAEVNRSQAISRISTLETTLRNAGWARQQVVASLFAACAAFALLLAAGGLYAVVSYAVTSRSYEFALRTAVGATRLHIAGLVWRSVGSALAFGVATGVALAALLDRPLAAWTEAALWHPVALAFVTALFIVSAAVATAAPARRAARISPMEAFRA